MDAQLRDLERKYQQDAIGSASYWVAYCRLTGTCQYSGNIRSRVLSLWLFRNTDDAAAELDEAIRKRRLNDYEMRRRAWILRHVASNHLGRNLVVQGEWLTYYLVPDDKGPSGGWLHKFVDSGEYYRTTRDKVIEYDQNGKPLRVVNNPDLREWIKVAVNLPRRY